MSYNINSYIYFGYGKFPTVDNRTFFPLCDMPTALTLPNKSNQVLQTTIRSQSILGPQVKLKGKGEVSENF